MNFTENKREIIAKGKWMTMKEIHYTDPKNTARVGTYNIIIIVIIAIIRCSG